MTEKNLPATVDESPAQVPVVAGMGVSTPAATIAQATNIANELVAFLKSRPKLVVPISGKNYIKCEGWTTTGAMLGTFPRTEKTEERGDWSEGNYAVKATVSVQTLDGREVTRADALCSQRETMSGRPRWNDEYAVMSMSETRATAKAYRQAFSWIIQMAGYEATPAEEMDGVRDKAQPQPQPQPQGGQQGGAPADPGGNKAALENLPILDATQMEEAQVGAKVDEETARKYVWTAAMFCAGGDTDEAQKIIVRWSSFEGTSGTVTGPGHPWKKRDNGGFVLSPKWLRKVFDTAKEDLASFLASKKSTSTTEQLKQDLNGGGASSDEPPPDKPEDAPAAKISDEDMLRSDIKEEAMTISDNDAIRASELVDSWITALNFPAALTLEKAKKTRLKQLLDHARRMRWEWKQSRDTFGKKQTGGGSESGK